MRARKEGCENPSPGTRKAAEGKANRNDASAQCGLFSERERNNQECIIKHDQN